MIAGLASHGRSQDALKLFGRIGELGFKPDEKTITAVLSACRNSGLVAEGYKIYNNMRKFGLKPKIQHYGCMVDLLARAGQLKEAEGFIRRMPVKPDSLLWRNLIWASRFHKDMDRAKRLIEETKHLKLDSGNGDSYILKGNVYASDKNWEERARVRDLMMKQNVRKMPGCSRIEMKGVFHEFEAGDRKHPEREQIYRKWEEIAERLKIEGHKPKFSEVLLDVEDEEKALQLNHHSEKLAVAFGLMNTSPGEDILIVKNLRACKDCHDAMKLISRIYDRKIIVRDRIMFHHFSNGSCSCNDYW
ncbi:pentatricopeptide repeat-containing protein At5g66520-like [Asparagus officinalis]|uniref:pentatricopeptide repeat-containing protein At5g66520-like n=1 Tax=Asparagus officinalis TaxID=4686 RepID=UPI00098E0EA9|nr:pentatricopeptide repeat-containing protein At5g66520-like [Asparagus officinalis]